MASIGHFMVHITLSFTLKLEEDQCPPTPKSENAHLYDFSGPHFIFSLLLLNGFLREKQYNRKRDLVLCSIGAPVEQSFWEACSWVSMSLTLELTRSLTCNRSRFGKGGGLTSIGM